MRGTEFRVTATGPVKPTYDHEGMAADAMSDLCGALGYRGHYDDDDNNKGSYLARLAEVGHGILDEIRALQEPA